MCGINGIFAYHYAANPVDEAELLATRDYMIARGPDGAGAWLGPEGRIALAHRRLAILDLSEAGAQPMHSADGRFVISFNGEIYNYRELRRRLEMRGHAFRSTSDTEVLLALYADKGEAMLDDLRGMYAFAIWDARDRSLFLARDPNGIKPLYYCDDGWTFRFASQVKALLAGGGCGTAPDMGGIAAFYVFGYVPDPMTMFMSIRSLPAGTSMRVDGLGSSAPKSFCSLAEIMKNAAQAPPPSLDDVRVALLDSVGHHLISDVPVGAFLSAGVDSSAIVGLMRDAGQQHISTITIGFDEFENSAADETVLAATAGAHYGTDHSTRVVRRSEFEKDLSKILVAMDQPSIDGFNTWFVAKATRERGLKVALSGLGGDELIGGYKSFRQIPNLVRGLALPAHIPFLGYGLRKAATAMQLFERLNTNPKGAGIVEYARDYAAAYILRRGIFMPWELEACLGRELAEEGLRRFDPFQHVRDSLADAPHAGAFAKVAIMEGSLYMRSQLLRDSDWASMAHGLELRVPLVDVALQRTVAAYVLAHGAIDGKRLLAESPRRPIPAPIRTRRKTGFETPLLRWMPSRSPGEAQFARMRDLVRTMAGTCALLSDRASVDRQVRAA